MEFNKPLDVFSFDWDDSKLIEAYDRSVVAKKGSKSKRSKISKENAKDEKAAKPWQIGSYCRAIYLEDGMYYEAVIGDIDDKSCTVEFLGYGDCQDVLLDSLRPSLGKKARQKQRKGVKKAEISVCTSDTDYSCLIDPKDVSKAAKSAHLSNGNTIAGQCGHYAGAEYSPPHMQQHSTPPQPTCNRAMHAPMVYAPHQKMEGATCCLPAPPPPPMPRCSAATNDPSLSAMLVSWYMAGYYTGLHQNQKSSQCVAVPKTSCCSHLVPNHHSHFC